MMDTSKLDGIESEPQLSFAVKIPESLWLAVEHRLVERKITKKQLVIGLLKRFLEEDRS